MFLSVEDLKCDFKKDICKWKYEQEKGDAKWAIKDHNERSLLADGPLNGPIYKQKSKSTY